MSRWTDTSGAWNMSIEGEGSDGSDDDWVTPNTVDGVNELWEVWGIAGWKRGQEPEGWGADGERIGTGGEEVGHRRRSGLGPGSGMGARYGDVGAGTSYGHGDSSARCSTGGGEGAGGGGNGDEAVERGRVEAEEMG